LPGKVFPVQSGQARRVHHVHHGTHPVPGRDYG